MAVKKYNKIVLLCHISAEFIRGDSVGLPELFDEIAGA